MIASALILGSTLAAGFAAVEKVGKVAGNAIKNNSENRVTPSSDFTSSANKARTAQDHSLHAID